MFASMQNKYKCFWTHQKIIIIISEEGFNLFLQILGRQLNNFFKQRKHVFIRLINEMTFADTVATLLEILYHCCFRTLFKPKRSKEKEKKKRLQLFRDIENMQPCHIGYRAVFILTFMKTEMILSGVSAPCVCWNISVLYLTFRAEVSKRWDVVKGLRLDETTSYLRNL